MSLVSNIFVQEKQEEVMKEETAPTLVTTP